MQPTEFQLNTDTPDALCPELSMTRDAVKKRLGQLEVQGGGTWRGLYQTVHDPEGHRGDYIRLVISDPNGKEQASRELPLKGESCSTMAQAIALVVDGFFRDLGQSPGIEPGQAQRTVREAPSPARPVQNEAAHAGTKTNVTTPGATSGAAHQQIGQIRPGGSVGFIVGAGFESVPSSPCAALGWYVAIASKWRVDFRAAFPIKSESESFGSATAYAYPIPLRFSVAYAANLRDRLSIAVGPEFLTSLEYGSVQGVTNGHSGWRASFGPGMHLALGHWISPWFGIAANFSADAVLAKSRRFLIESDPALELARVRWAATLELWGALFP
jgi:hypothetical protein